MALHCLPAHPAGCMSECVCKSVTQRLHVICWGLAETHTAQVHTDMIRQTLLRLNAPLHRLEQVVQWMVLALRCYREFHSFTTYKSCWSQFISTEFVETTLKRTFIVSHTIYENIEAFDKLKATHDRGSRKRWLPESNQFDKLTVFWNAFDCPFTVRSQSIN